MFVGMCAESVAVGASLRFALRSFAGGSTAPVQKRTFDSLTLRLQVFYSQKIMENNEQ